MSQTPWRVDMSVGSQSTFVQNACKRPEPDNRAPPSVRQSSVIRNEEETKLLAQHCYREPLCGVGRTTELSAVTALHVPGLMDGRVSDFRPWLPGQPRHNTDTRAHAATHNRLKSRET
ncbi:hypothetical protein Bbelb_013370 [Branchiostoma belcheri]|nr:hypothetical protein Bbelb_013370 [Branchiostoma belcheri]